MIWLDGVEHVFSFLIAVKFQKVTPNSLKLQSISGFGYSFSNSVHNVKKENGVPYVAVGAVNITGDSVVTCIVAKSENQLDLDKFKDPNAGSEDEEIHLHD